MTIEEQLAEARAALAQAMADNEQLCAYLFFATGMRFAPLPFYNTTHTGEPMRGQIEAA